MKLSTKGFGAIGIILAIVVVGILGFVGYSAYISDSENTETTSEQAPQTVASEDTQEQVLTSGTVITTGASDFGTMLFDSNNQAIYIWEVEDSSIPECYGDCAVAWPPVLTSGAPVASGEVSGDLLGTTTRTNGATQVTYNGKPLYYYADEEPGEVKCHNVSTHGGLWWVIQPDGTPAD